MKSFKALFVIFILVTTCVLAVAAGPAEEGVVKKVKHLFPGTQIIKTHPGTARVSALKGRLHGSLDLRNKEMVSAFLRQKAGAFGKLGAHSRFKVNRVKADTLGYLHARVDQYYKELPVFGAELALHSDNRGMLYFINGKTASPNLPRVTATVSAESALAVALDDIDAAVYGWESPEMEKSLKELYNDPSLTWRPTPELGIVPDSLTGQAGRYYLAYKIEILAVSPVAAEWLYFVDAENGRVIHKLDTCKRAAASANGQTLHYGGKSFIANYRKRGKNSTYQLVDPGRKVYSYHTTYVGGSAVLRTDADNYWDGNNTVRAGVEAHWGAGRIYDFLQSYGRKSINGRGMTIKVNTGVVDDPWGYFPGNAVWYAGEMWIGAGGVGNWDHLSALDIVAHEMGHGVTGSESNLTYSYESGALNEAFSDMMGAAAEFYALPASSNWLIGEVSYYPANLSRALRSMENPNAGNQPDTYLGDYWYTGSGDNGGVHYNSGVANFQFYLLADGGSGTNDNNEAYNVQGIGVSKAFRIWLHANSNFFLSSTNYANARTLTIQAAQDLYGTSSSEATQTANAWDAVGVN